jgi:hypothetical protein
MIMVTGIRHQYLPLSLPLQPREEETLQPDWDETLYDPPVSVQITGIVDLSPQV